MSLLDRLRQFTRKPLTALKKHGHSSSPASAVRPAAQEKITTAPEEKTTGKAEQRQEKGPVQGGILLRPVITEKATLTETYVFDVDPHATKHDVRRSVAATYGVLPVHVRIMNVRGKQVRWAGRNGSRKSWKKAIVRLPKGKTISVYEGT